MPRPSWLQAFWGEYIIPLSGLHRREVLIAATSFDVDGLDKSPVLAGQAREESGYELESRS